MQQDDVDRVQEFRKCIECFLCQDVCHVLRDHHKHDEFIGPRFLVYAAALEMHPLDTEDRVPELKDAARHRLLQHHQVLHEGLSRAHHDHRQRDHPAQGTRRRRFYDPVTKLLRVFRVREVTRWTPCSSSKPLSTDADPGGAGEGRALPAAERAGRGREHLPRRARRSIRQNQEALVMLLLALTDQFPTSSSSRARSRAPASWLPRLADEYERAYYAGIIRERRAKAVLQRDRYGAAATAAEWLREAMAFYEQAEADPAGGQRRCAAALERVRAPADAPAGTGSRRSRARAAAARVTQGRPSID